MATTTARTKADVDNMTARDRLWDSLNYSYGKKRENSDEQFRQAYSQADRQMLSRGMQRSSYGAQTLANLDKQRVDAQNDIYDNQIADYENRLYQLERDEKADDQWERQFAEGQRQYNENMGFQRERAAAQDNQWNLNFDYQKARDAEADRQWKLGFDAQQAQQAEANRQWRETFNYQQSRDAVSDQQWLKAFDQNNVDTDRKLAASYVSAIIANGQNPTDELLARAGLSRADANAMKAQIVAGGGGWGGGSSGGGRSSTKPKSNPQPDTGSSWNDFANAFSNTANSVKKTVASSPVGKAVSNVANGVSKNWSSIVSSAIKKANPTNNSMVNPTDYVGNRKAEDITKKKK